MTVQNPARHGSPARTIIDENDQQVGIAARPLRVDPVGTTVQPVNIVNADVTLNVTATGLATSAKQDTEIASLANLDVALSSRTKPADQQHAIIDSGTTVVTQPTGSNLHVVVDSAPSTVVTGPLTDTQLRATAVPISLAVAPTTAVTNAGLTNLDVLLSTRLKPADTLVGVTTLGTITNVVHVDDNAGSITVDGPLTDTQLRATAVPVSGTVATGGLTDTQLRATAVPVSAVALPLPSGAATSAGQDTENAYLATLVALSKTEDAASASGDTGVPALAVRKDDPAGILQSSDGDYAALSTDRFGNLQVRNSESDTLRRIEETAFILQMQASLNALVASESETSQRAGIEFR